MSKQELQERGIMRKQSQKELLDALAAIIASTKRKKRKLNPLEVAEKIQTAWNNLGSLSEVAKSTGMSTEMLRQIHSVRNCSEQVKQLVRERKLESYDILHRISKFPSRTQMTVAKAVISGDLASEDVRAIVTFSRSFPGRNIASVVKRIIGSRDIKEYVVYFVLESARKPLADLRSQFETTFGKANIVSLQENDGVGELVLDVEGKERLAKLAKAERITKRRFIQKFVADRF